VVVGCALVSEDPARIFATANEIHIPVGEPVRFKLASADVIHSFWVPALSGKADLIPGQTNVTWLQADEPGVYWVQCAEYCGRQHAHMALRLFADPAEEFEA
jgi:cytochrome c oxidase subunit II